VRKRKDRVYEDKPDGIISFDTYERKHTEYTKDEADLEDALIKINDKTDEYQKLGVVIHELAYYAKEIYQKATVDEKRILLSQIFTNLAQDGLEIKPNFTLAVQYLGDWMPKLNSDYEPEKILTTKGKSEDFASLSPIWLRRQDLSTSSRLFSVARIINNLTAFA